jgi:SAM-dependent methyltransferase
MGTDQVAKDPKIKPQNAETQGYENRAQFYDIEYAETRDHGFLTSLIGPNARRIMVLPGGTGTTATALQKARPECTIYSVDIEPEMVTVAQDRFGGPSVSSPVSVLGDMIDLEFDVAFDHIFVAREAFQMLPDDASALACLISIKQSLSKSGRAVLDVANFDTPAAISDLNYYDASRNDGQPYLDCRQPYGNGTLLRHVTQFSDPTGNRRFKLNYQIESPDSAPSVSFGASLALRKYDLPALQNLIKQAGLSICDIYGDYEKSPYTPNSPRICCILGKT